MKRGKLFAGTSAVWVVSASVAQAALSLNFSALPNSAIQFNGNDSSFSFTSGPGAQWGITTVSGGVQDSVGLQGSFAGGPWTYGPITVAGNMEYAAVTTMGGTFVINDGFGGTATGTVNWGDIMTVWSVGALNATASFNVTDMTYTHGNTPAFSSDLATLVAKSAGSINLTFQFNPGKTLTQLTSGSGPYLTSYSGSLTPVIPEPGTLLAGAALLLPFVASTLRCLRKPSIGS